MQLGLFLEEKSVTRAR